MSGNLHTVATAAICKDVMVITVKIKRGMTVSLNDHLSAHVPHLNFVEGVRRRKAECLPYDRFHGTRDH